MSSHKKLANVLTKFIAKNENKRELKRALAVKLYLEGCTLKETAKHLDSSFQFVWKWNKKYLTGGTESLRLGHQGSSSYLTEKMRCNIKYWLRKQEGCTVEELENYILKRYEIRFKSRQSYYALLKEAHLSFKKIQKIHPKRKAQQIASGRYRLKKTVGLAKRRNTGKPEAFLLSG